MGLDMVTLTVGTSQKVFKVHRKILCDRIPYFDKMFRGLFQEAITSTAIFPEDDPGMFDLLLRWVYDGTIPSVTWSGRDKDGNGGDNEGDEGEFINENDDSEQDYYDYWATNWNPLRLYILADKLNVTEVMDRVMDEYTLGLKLHTLEPDAEDYELVYKSSPAGSVLRKYHAHCFAWELVNYEHENTWFQTMMVDFPDLAKDIVPHLRGTAESKMVHPRDVLPSCEYHSHEKADVCPWEGLGSLRRKTSALEK